MTTQESALAICNRMTVHPKTAALLAYITNHPLTNPFITGHAVTSDGFVMVSTNEDAFLNCLFGTFDQLLEKVIEITDFACQNDIITSDEQTELVLAFTSKIHR